MKKHVLHVRVGKKVKFQPVSNDAEIYVKEEKTDKLRGIITGNLLEIHKSGIVIQVWLPATVCFDNICEKVETFVS